MTTAIENELRDAVRQWLDGGGTQAKLADGAGCTQSVVSDFLRGSRPRLDVAERIAESIGRPLKLSGKRRSKASG